MDKNTLSNYGWVVIAVLVLAVMIALATPFGSYIRAGVENTTAGLFDTSEKALNVVGMSAGDGSFGGNTGTSTPDPALNPTNVIITDGKYSYGDYTYETSSALDTFGFASVDEFKENCLSITGVTWDDFVSDSGMTEEQVIAELTHTNIKVIVTDKSKASYGPILESINGQPITDISYTFRDCTSLTTAPEIPSSVTDMDHTFYGCTNLTTAPVIPNSVTNMNSTFQNCTALTTAPEIPNSVTIMSYTFWNCTNLTTAPEIPNSVTNMSYTFMYCTALTTAPEIPNSVTNMGGTFHDCTSLTTAPEIPNSVTYIYFTFQNCTSLTGEISIPCSHASKNYTYTNCPATITYYHIDGCDGSCGA